MVWISNHIVEAKWHARHYCHDVVSEHCFAVLLEFDCLYGVALDVWFRSIGSPWFWSIIKSNAPLFRSDFGACSSMGYGVRYGISMCQGLESGDSIWIQQRLLLRGGHIATPMPSDNEADGSLGWQSDANAVEQAGGHISMSRPRHARPAVRDGVGRTYFQVACARGKVQSGGAVTIHGNKRVPAGSH